MTQDLSRGSHVQRKNYLRFDLILFFIQMPEEEAFCVFVKLMQDYRLRELFKPSMAELGLCMYQFEFMIQVKPSDLLPLFTVW